MSHGSHERPSPPRWRRLLSRRPDGPLRGTVWSVGTPLVVLLCGALFVVSAENSDGTDLRPGRYTDLAQLVRAESRQYERLQARLADLNAEVTRLTASVGDRDVARHRRQIEELKDPAGLEPKSGPGVTVTLTDSPVEVAEAAPDTVDPNAFVVHQQDIQAVVNAMWKGGAEAVTVQGKRLVSTTGIKCIGNSVTLQGRPYSPPYVISAVGDQGDLLAAIDEDEYVDLYRSQADRSDIAIGWDLELEEELNAPAYDGLLDLRYATPVR